MPEELDLAVTGRHGNLFAVDLAARESQLKAAISGSRLLVVGGAGSIGAAATRMALRYIPAAVHVVDHNENSLAELVRDLRADGLAPPGDRFRTLPLDLGSVAMQRFLQDHPGYDLVLNFAALKHVRSEKDAYSLLQMLDTNLARATTMMAALAQHSPDCAYFAVSTDKAANPVSLMGASKRLMEHVVFARERGMPELRRVTSARFANVAFSDGSLLDSVLRRLGKRQVVACPLGIHRYFITAEEAAAICLLAAIATPDRHILVPLLNEQEDLKDLAEVVRRIMRERGVIPIDCRDEAEARQILAAPLSDRAFPLLLTSADTDGEKPTEEFIGPGEAMLDIGLERARAVRHRPGPEGSLVRVMERIQRVLSVASEPVSKAALVGWIGEAVPELVHAETGLSLDDRV